MGQLPSGGGIRIGQRLASAVCSTNVVVLAVGSCAQIPECDDLPMRQGPIIPCYETDATHPGDLHTLAGNVYFDLATGLTLRCTRSGTGCHPERTSLGTAAPGPGVIQRGTPAMGVAGELRQRDHPHHEGVIVVGFDGSQGAWRALSYAVGRAREEHARLVVAFVEMPWYPTTGGIGCDLLIPNPYSQLAKALLDEVSVTLQSADVDWEFRRRSGRRAMELASLDNLVKADAVIVGATHRRSARLSGCVSSHLMRRGCWPITIVP